MTDFQDRSFTLIGTGALGGALADLLDQESCSVRSAFNSKGGFVKDVDGHSETSDQPYPADESESGDVIFICVPDDMIPVVAKKLSGTTIDWSNKSVVHCSGNLFSDELDVLADKGAQIASMHPLQTFRRGDKADRFGGIFVSLEGRKELCDELEAFINRIGAKPLRVQKEQKQILHIAAVFASNYVVAILHEAEQLLKRNGIENSLKPLEPLVRQTIENSMNTGPAESLSGPIARGDAESVRKHLHALARNSESLALYSALGQKTVTIAREKDSALKARLDTIEQLLHTKTDR
jgi:predicted short-subunit dehydrogenase-like oxidoreductase (DUF2520 family)